MLLLPLLYVTSSVGPRHKRVDAACRITYLVNSFGILWELAESCQMDFKMELCSSASATPHSEQHLEHIAQVHFQTRDAGSFRSCL